MRANKQKERFRKRGGALLLLLHTEQGLIYGIGSKVASNR